MSLNERTPARRIHLRGSVENRADADDRLAQPGDVVLVNRGLLRSAVMACPDGCGSVLTINLDPRAGKAWRVQQDSHGFSLYPSVWREGGCQSHFIVWRDRISWCGPHYEIEDAHYDSRALEKRIIGQLGAEWASLDAISERLNEVPWSVSQAIANLVAQGLVEQGGGGRTDFYRRARSGTDGPIPGKKVGLFTRLWRWVAGHPE